MEHKYICNGKFFILWPADAGISHSEMARATGFKVVSAGFADLATGNCWGESVSLNLMSKPEDTTLLQKQIHG